MRIVTKQEFYKLPSGTVYCHYRPIILEGLYIKGETIYCDGNPCDYIETELIHTIDVSGSDEFFDKMIEAEKDSSFSMKMDFECTVRNGFYNEDQMYAIYEKKDIEGLIQALQKALERY